MKKASEAEESVLEQLVTNNGFLEKASATFHSTAGDVVKGILEGASKFRQILKVFQNILLLKE